MTPPTPRAPVPSPEGPTSPLPWSMHNRGHHQNEIVDSEGIQVALVYLTEETAGNAALIKQAVNAYPSHQLLVEALELCLATLDNEHIGTSHYMEGSTIYEDFEKAANAARAALASAGKTGRAE